MKVNDLAKVARKQHPACIMTCLAREEFILVKSHSPVNDPKGVPIHGRAGHP